MDFHRVTAPVFFPTECFVCKLQKHPDGMIDTLVSVATTASPNARVYLCPVCVTAAARLLGFSEPGLADELESRLEERGRLLDAMKVELEKAQDLRVVSGEELREWAASTGQRAPKAARPKEKVA